MTFGRIGFRMTLDEITILEVPAIKRVIVSMAMLTLVTYAALLWQMSETRTFGHFIRDKNKTK